MATIINQEPLTREQMAFSYIRFVNSVITDPIIQGGNEYSAREGRLLRPNEEDTYDRAHGVLNKYFTYEPGLHWRSEPTENGLYLLAYLTEARMEAALVLGNQFHSLYDLSVGIRLVGTVSCLWLGPLPPSPMLRSSQEV